MALVLNKVENSAWLINRSYENDGTIKEQTENAESYLQSESNNATLDEQDTFQTNQDANDIGRSGSDNIPFYILLPSRDDKPKNSGALFEYWASTSARRTMNLRNLDWTSHRKMSICTIFAKAPEDSFHTACKGKPLASIKPVP